MESFKNLLINIKDNKPLFISLVIGVFIVVLGFVVFLLPSVFNVNNVYNDPLSGETIYDPAGRTPETFNESPQPNYLGFTGLVDSGVPFDVTQSLKEELSPLTIDGEKVTEISVDIKSIQSTSDDVNRMYNFRIRINRKYDYQLNLNVKFADDSFTFNISGPGANKLSFD